MARSGTMTLIWVVLVIAIIGGTVAVALGRGSGLATVHRDEPAFTLPTDRPVRAEDLDHARFGVGARGYRMDEVDGLLARLREEIAERDRRLATLDPAYADDHPRGLPTPSTAARAPQPLAAPPEPERSPEPEPAADPVPGEDGAPVDGRDVTTER